MIRVSVVSQYDFFLNNRIFLDPTAIEGAQKGNDHWLRPFGQLHGQAQSEGFLLETYDRLPPERADLVVFFDLPPERAIVERLRRDHPRVGRVLMAMESPLFNAAALDRRNHAVFDRVLSFRAFEPARGKYFRYRLPVWPPSECAPSLPFRDRAVAVMINANQTFGPRARWRSIKDATLRGWRPSVATAISIAMGGRELYSKRRALVRAMHQAQPGSLAIHGRGWEGWPGNRGVLNENKLSLLGKFRFNLAFENALDDDGYVSEKVWDAFFGGTVPVYLGNAGIADALPSEAFIDGRRFADPHALARHLVEMDEATWSRLAENASRFREWDALKPYLAERFASDVIACLKSFPIASS